ncbi:olfactory receptor 6M1-like [Microcaecilia unicolor]|uniref:Olfactory receptor n=1 Tax=Microcaecilia unicolor TaxID=1415580 RepID=A0A6P7WPU9_9AMPH|nr:olfactory receptor 6M1-like [Microcaecilia unicolor]
MAWRNETTVTEFIFQGFPRIPQLQISLFVSLLVIYLTTLTGNILMIVVIWLDYRLHTPMYLFLINLSFLETCFVSLLVPKMLVDFLSEKKMITFNGCMTQCYFYFLMGTTDFFLLTTMSYDRYVAICHPLHYPTIMSNKLCIQLVIGCWVVTSLLLLPPIILLSRLPFCGPKVINHFFCDSSTLLNLACTNTDFIKLINLIISIIVLVGPLLLIVVSYVYIISTILRIPSAHGRNKAFSTCASHLSMVTISFGSAIFIEIRPTGKKSSDIDKAVLMVSSILAPLLNPFIYTLRNEKVKDALRDALNRSVRRCKKGREIKV